MTAPLDELIKQFNKINSSDSTDGDDITDITKTLALGIVIDTDDPLQMGRLRIFCPSFGDDPDKLQHIQWASYVTPFGGSINNSCYARGHQPGQEFTNGAVHYGLWAIPEQGAHVLLGCVNGDHRRRFWLGCMPEHQETHTLFHGRYDWENGGIPDGPLSSSNSPIEPLYTNFGTAFEDRESQEWKTRGADYQVTAVDEDVGELPNPSKSTYLDNQYQQISEAEQDDWVKPILGAHGYDWSGYKGLGAFKSSRVYGLTTPGFHSLSLDDRPFNSRVRLRTTAGHQILLDDTNERIYISTYEGDSWVEMDKAGNIDMYAKRRVSIHAEKDINLSSDETVRIKGNKGVHIHAGDNRGQAPLDSIPADGQIRLHSTDDTHFYVEGNLRKFIENDVFEEVEGSVNSSIGGGFEQLITGAAEIASSASMVLGAGQSLMSLSPSSMLLQSASNLLMSNLGSGFSSSLDDVRSQFDSMVDIFDNAQTVLETTQIALDLSIILAGGIPTTIPPPSTMIDIPSLGLTELVPDISPAAAETEFAIWTNRVPEHEPWPRVVKQDSDDEVNEMNDGYMNNVDWIDQYDNETSPEGLEPIGQVEGDEELPRSDFWRR